MDGMVGYLGSVGPAEAEVGSRWWGDRWSWGAAEISGKKTSLGAQKHLVLLVPRDLGSRTV